MNDKKSYEVQARIFCYGEVTGKKGDIIELPASVGDAHCKTHVKGKDAPLKSVKSK